jgi:hypothetical protein
MQKKRIAIVLILIGIASFFLSVLFATGYEPGYGLLGNVERMEFVLRENPVNEPISLSFFDRIEAEKRLGRKETEDESGKREAEEQKKYEKWWEAYWEGQKNRIAVPYKFFLAADIIIVFTGLGLLIVPAKETGSR